MCETSKAETRKAEPQVDLKLCPGVQQGGLGVAHAEVFC
jgi:hypothetical protein